MAETISDYTFNPWRENGGNRIVAKESVWHEPVVWNRKAGEGACRSCGGKGVPLVRINDRKRVRSEFACEACDGTGEGKPYRARVFCASLADVFEDWTWPMLDAKGKRLQVGPDGKWFVWEEEITDQEDLAWVTMQDVRNRLFRLIDATPHLDWLLLTKRPENIGRMMPEMAVPFGDNYRISGPKGALKLEVIRKNLWLGTSIENRATRERIDELRTIPAAIRFLSIEPLLEDLGKVDLTGIDWVITGGESGPKARPCNVDWIRSIVRQCKAAGVACFVKQLGSNPRITFRELCELKPNPPAVDCAPDTLDRLPLKDPKGGDMSEWPADLRSREMPR